MEKKRTPLHVYFFLSQGHDRNFTVIKKLNTFFLLLKIK